MKKRKELSYNICKNIVRGIIVSILIFKIITKDYENLEIVLLTFALTFYDKIVENVLSIKLKKSLKCLLLIFIFLAQILGTTFHFYQIFSWWDIFLHTLSGILAYFVGLDILKSYNKKRQNKIISFIFAICFSLSTGVIWEIFEFLVDHFLGKNAQMARGKVGLNAVEDTMVDLISLTIGTFVSFYFHALTINKKKTKRLEY